MTNKKLNGQQHSVAENIAAVNDKIAEAAALAGRDAKDIAFMAVTKTVSPEIINQAFDCGIRLFGENRVQEYLSKIDEYKYGTENTHFIGHLQSNKVKYIIDKVSMIESVSSLKLLNEISRCAVKSGLTMPVLLEVNIGNEPTKSGFLPEELNSAVKTADSLGGVFLRGVMAIPPKNNSDYYFAKMQQIFVDISQITLDNSNIDTLSMGMSGDYQAAIKYGSNIVRLGTAVFGAREYQH